MSVPKDKILVITFTGGMGAQIISAALYFQCRQAGLAVYANMTYFDRPEKLATVGDIGQVTHWGWALDKFGYTIDSFDTGPYPAGGELVLLTDSPDKVRLSLDALTRPEVRACFALPPRTPELTALIPDAPFACIHVRRGDYVNVATHVVTDKQFKSIIGKCAGLLDRAVILSDSPIDEEFRQAVRGHFKHIDFLDNVDAFASHCIMRAARMLVCSNSQFSLVAATLNPDAFTIVPKQWYDDSMRAYEDPVHALSTFEVLDMHR